MKSNHLAIYSKKSVENMGNRIGDSIGYIDINIIAHFGNIPVVELVAWNGQSIFGGYNCEGILSTVLRKLVEFFDLEKEDGVRIRELVNIPVAIIFNQDNQVVGFGNASEDKFIFNQHLIDWAIAEHTLEDEM